MSRVTIIHGNSLVCDHGVRIMQDCQACTARWHATSPSEPLSQAKVANQGPRAELSTTDRLATQNKDLADLWLNAFAPNIRAMEILDAIEDRAMYQKLRRYIRAVPIERANA